MTDSRNTIDFLKKEEQREVKEEKKIEIKELNNAQKDLLDAFLGSEGNYSSTILDYTSIDIGMKVILLERAITESCQGFLRSLDKLYSNELKDNEKSNQLDFIRSLKFINDIMFDNEVKYAYGDDYQTSKLLKAREHYFGKLGNLCEISLMDNVTKHICSMIDAIIFKKDNIQEAINEIEEKRISFYEWEIKKKDDKGWRSECDLPYTQNPLTTQRSSLSIFGRSSDMSEEEIYRRNIQMTLEENIQSLKNFNLPKDALSEYTKTFNHLNAQDNLHIALGIRALKKTHILDAEILGIFIKNPRYGIDLSSGFNDLEKAGILSTYKHILIKNIASSHSLGGVLCQVHASRVSRDDKILLSNLAIKMASNTVGFSPTLHNLCSGLEDLSHNNLATYDNIKILFQHPDNATKLSYGFTQLKYSSLLDTYRDLLVDHAKYASELGHAISSLGYNRVHTSDNISRLTSKPEQARKIADEIISQNQKMEWNNYLKKK